MKTTLLAALGAIVLSVSAHAQVFDPAALAAAKSAGASAAAGPQAIQLDGEGRPVLDAQGKTIPVAKGAGTMADNLRMFQNMTGVEGVEQGLSPAQEARSGSASVTVNQSFTFNCRLTPPGKIFNAGALSFRLEGCFMAAGSTTQVQRADLRVCDAATKAGSCSSVSTYDQPLALTANVFSSFNGMQVGLGCNSVSECQVSVKGQYAVGGSDATLKAGAQQAGGTSGLVGDLRNVITEGGYAEKMVEIGRPLADCAAANRDNPNGDAVSCDGEQVVKITPPSSNCSTVRECLREAVSVQTFERTCQRTFAVTERQTKLSYTKTLTCEIEVFKDPGVPSTNSCVTADNPNPTDGYTLVGSTPKACTPDDATCVSEKHTEYWVDMEATEVLGVTESPFPVSGSCDVRPESGSRYSTCDSWFGRTADTAQCVGLFVDESTGAPAGGGLPLDYTQSAGCGFCVAPTVGVSCYGSPTPQQVADGAQGADSCNSLDLSSCTFKSAEPMTFTSAGGLVQSQQETYSCRTETTQCVQWSATGSDPSCMTQDLAMGTDKLASYRGGSSEALNAALVAAATLDSTAAGLEGGSSTVPKLFTGSDMRCNRPAGGMGSFLANNCCRTDLERPKEGNVFKSGCSMDEAKLAAARRSSYSSYVGEYCSRKFWGKCLRYTQSYCVFEGILPRLVQEQGRVQLRNITASSASDSLQRAPISFKYLDASGGSWSAPVTVNGVRVSAWQWPSYCATTEQAYQQLLNDPSAPGCPGVVSTWFASCDQPGGCGPLPGNPQDGSFEWSLAEVNPLESSTSAISRFAVATGACSTATQDCSYQLSAWPVGTGGRAVVTRDLTWSLFAKNEAPAVEGQPAPAVYQMSNIGDLMFRGYSQDGEAGGALPATVRLDLSRDGGQTWTMFQIPTSQGSAEQSLTGDVKVIGSCDAATNTCTFRATGTTVVTLKRPFPDENPRAPDCSGFTAGQLAVLDFSKMDLSEWLSSVLGKNGAATSPEGLAEAASAQFAEFNSLFQQGKVKSTAPVSAMFARAVPAEGFGPFNVRLAVGGAWPEVTGDPALDTDTVISAEVDWGDCSPKETLVRMNMSEGNGFRGVHQYLGPADRNPTTGAYQHGCLAAQYGGNLERNLVHKVTITVNTLKSGVQTRELSVENAWSRFPGANSNSVTNPINVTTTPDAAKIPAPPRP